MHGRSADSCRDRCGHFRPHGCLPAAAHSPRDVVRARTAARVAMPTPTTSRPAPAPVAVDSGFIVLNDRTYPLLNRLFAELGVAISPTEMSMSIALRRLRTGLRRRPRRRRHLRPATPARRSAVPADARARYADSSAWPDSTWRADPGSLETYGEFLETAPASTTLHPALCAAGRRVRLVDGRGQRPRLPGGVPVRVPRQPRLPEPSVTRRSGTSSRADPQLCRRPASPSRRCPDRRSRHRGHPQGRPGRAARCERTRARLRPGGDRDACRRGARLLTDASERSSTSWGRSTTPSNTTQLHPTSACCAMTVASARAGTSGSPPARSRWTTSRSATG